MVMRVDLKVDEQNARRAKRGGGYVDVDVFHTTTTNTTTITTTSITCIR